MNNESVDRAERARHRRQAARVKESMRELNSRLSLLNRRFSTRAAMKDIDWDCLELINQHGPIGPSDLARRVGVHPATLTGVLDRLQRGGWIERERDPDSADRRAVVVTPRRDRNHELFRLFSGMNSKMDELCDAYTEDELALIADFLNRAADAGRQATDDFTDLGQWGLSCCAALMVDSQARRSRNSAPGGTVATLVKSMAQVHPVPGTGSALPGSIRLSPARPGRHFHLVGRRTVFKPDSCLDVAFLLLPSQPSGVVGAHIGW